MSAYSAANVSKAIERIPGTATKDLRKQIDRAEENGIAAFVAAARDELALRGTADFDDIAAKRHVAWSLQAAGLDLGAAIRMAFREAPINEAELRLTRLIAASPGIGYQDLAKLSGKRDASLILGHMIYDRLGFFRSFWAGAGLMSDLLFERDNSSGRVHYRLATVAEQAFRELGILPSPGQDPLGTG